MGEMGEILGFAWQGRLELEGEAGTVVELLRETMDGVDRAIRRQTLKERLGLKGLGCCGATWGVGPTTISVIDEEQEGQGPSSPETEVAHNQQIASPPTPTPTPTPAPPCVGVTRSPESGTGMNLAAALAAERQFRAAGDSENGGNAPSPGPPSNERSPATTAAASTATGTAPGTPSRVSLMRLLEETDGCDADTGREADAVGGGSDSVCCVCMGRKKGAAFIPCGHTFCRVCSRELWLNRGYCPLCNRLILEILDIY